MKWPRKNDSDSIRARQEALGLDGEVTGIDLEPFVKAHYSTLPNAGGACVLGAGSGALMALYAAWMRPDRFGSAVAIDQTRRRERRPGGPVKGEGQTPKERDARRDQCGAP